MRQDVGVVGFGCVAGGVVCVTVGCMLFPGEEMMHLNFHKGLRNPLQ